MQNTDKIMVEFIEERVGGTVNDSLISLNLCEKVKEWDMCLLSAFPIIIAIIPLGIPR